MVEVVSLITYPVERELQTQQPQQRAVRVLPVVQEAHQVMVLLTVVVRVAPVKVVDS